MDCYGWLIAPFQLLSCTQKLQAEAKIMDLFSTHTQSKSDFMWSQITEFVCVCVSLWEHVPMFMPAGVCEKERETTRNEWVFAEWVQKCYIFIDKHVHGSWCAEGISMIFRCYQGNKAIFSKTHRNTHMHEVGQELPHKYKIQEPHSTEWDAVLLA